MIAKRRLAALIVLASGCVVVARPHPPPPPPPPIISEQQAIEVAAEFARSRGLAIDRTLAARLDPHGRWRIDVAGAGGRDRAHVLVNGYTGRVLRAKLTTAGRELAPEPPPAAPPAIEPPPPPGAPPSPPPRP